MGEEINVEFLALFLLFFVFFFLFTLLFFLFFGFKYCEYVTSFIDSIKSNGFELRPDMYNLSHDRW